MPPIHRVGLSGRMFVEGLQDLLNSNLLDQPPTIRAIISCASLAALVSTPATAISIHSLFIHYCYFTC